MIYLGLVVAWLVGFGAVRLLLPGPLRWSLQNVLVLSLGAGAGIGICSSLYFLCLAIAGPEPAVLIPVEALALVAIWAAGFLLKPRATALEWAPGPATPWYLTGALVLALGAAVTTFLLFSLTSPHGEWDAWSIWNLRARFLFRGAEFWRDAFAAPLYWSHPDYPLLLPGIVALCWSIAGKDSTSAPIAVAFLFTFAGAAVLTAALGILRGKAQAFVAGILLLGTASFVRVGATQYADIPLSFFILATLALLCLQERYPEDLRFTALAGLTAGLAAWTKNEGLMFVLIAIAARAIALVRFGDRTKLARQLAALGAGLVAPIALVVFFKFRFAPANDLVGKQSLRDMTARLMDFSRFLTVLFSFGKEAFIFGNFLIPAILVLVLYWYLMRFKVDQRDRSMLATVLLALGLMFVGDFAVYILLPRDVGWQLNTSLGRIFLQLWPAGVLAFFLALNPPQLLQPQAPEKTKPAKKLRK